MESVERLALFNLKRHRVKFQKRGKPRRLLLFFLVVTTVPPFVERQKKSERASERERERDRHAGKQRKTKNKTEQRENKRRNWDCRLRVDGYGRALLSSSVRSRRFVFFPAVRGALFVDQSGAILRSRLAVQLPIQPN